MKRLRKKKSGFTLIEILVAVVILSIGLLGMAMMTIMVIRGIGLAERQTHATNLAQQLIERMKDVTWSQLGGDTSCPASTATTFGNGMEDAACRVDDINAFWEKDPGGSTRNPPYIYTVYMAICDDSSLTPTVHSSPPTNHKCNITYNTSTGATANVPSELVCAGNTLKSGEKSIRVMVAWHDTTKGSCRALALDTVKVY